MKTHIKLILILILALIWGCNNFLSKQSVIGTFTFNKTEFSYDTLIIHSNGTYDQRIFSKHLDQLLTNSGRWKYSEQRIVLQDFIANDNQEFRATAYKDASITSCMPVSYCGTKICIESMADMNYYYVKIE